MANAFYFGLEEPAGAHSFGFAVIYSDISHDTKSLY